MDTIYFEATLPEETFYASGFLFVEAKDENTVVLALSRALMLLENLEEALLLASDIDHFDNLANFDVGSEVTSRVICTNGDMDRAGHEFRSQCSDRRWPRGGEHECLPPLCQCG